MSVVKFPGKGHHHDDDMCPTCTCKYQYRLQQHIKTKKWGFQIAENLGEELDIIYGMEPFNTEEEAEAAAKGFLEALHFIEEQQ
jgi:hypothetical protein